jgi:hypothetical protein
MIMTTMLAMPAESFDGGTLSLADRTGAPRRP